MATGIENDYMNYECVSKQPKQDVELKNDTKFIKPVQKKKRRCFSCNKKVGIFGFECNCGYVFCNGHRLPFEHSCTVSRKNVVNLPKIQTKKMESI